MTALSVPEETRMTALSGVSIPHTRTQTRPGGMLLAANGCPTVTPQVDAGGGPGDNSQPETPVLQFGGHEIHQLALQVRLTHPNTTEEAMYLSLHERQGYIDH